MAALVSKLSSKAPFTLILKRAVVWFTRHFSVAGNNKLEFGTALLLCHGIVPARCDYYLECRALALPRPIRKCNFRCFLVALAADVASRP